MYTSKRMITFGLVFLIAMCVVVVTISLQPARTATAQQLCPGWICDTDPVTGQTECHWEIVPECPGLATPEPYPTLVATYVATPGNPTDPIPPTDPLVQPCDQAGYVYNQETGCLACASSPYPNVAGASVCQPCQSVTRQPYPRGLVADEMRFRVYGPDVAEAVHQVCTDQAECSANLGTTKVKDVKYYLRWERAGDQIPIWFWDERTWNVRNHSSPDTGFGWSAIHTYQTSSYSLNGDCYEDDLNCDKPLNGPALDSDVNPSHRLPAYQVHVLTPWYGQYRVTYLRLRQYKDCVVDKGNPYSICCDNEVGGGCNPVWHNTPPIPPGDTGCKTKWRDCTFLDPPRDPNDPADNADCWSLHDTGWQTIDMRALGFDYSFVYGGRAGNEATSLEGARCNVVPVPVIEVQGVLDQNRP